MLELKNISGKYGEVFCVGSGKPRSIQFMLDTLLSVTTKEGIKDEIDPDDAQRLIIELTQELLAKVEDRDE